MFKSLPRLFSVVLVLVIFPLLQVNADTALWQGAVDKKGTGVTFSHAGKDFTALRVYLETPDDRVNLLFQSKTQLGRVVYETRYNLNLEGRNGLEQLVDNLCQLPGDYELKISGKAASCTIMTEQYAPLPALVRGDQLGELVVTGTGGAVVTAAPDRCQIRHPDFKKGMENGISSPDGAIHFRLPAGYWVLKRSGNGTGFARLIPVSSGRRTTVRWAASPEISVDTRPVNAVRRLEIRGVTSELGTDVAWSRFSLPAGLSTFTPLLEQLQVFERSLPAEIIDLKSSETPLHLVLLLDSSGSMKKSMKSAIDATVKFIESLPADATVEVIDFDTKAKPVKAKTRAELIKAVKAIRSDGATALRDSILLGLSQLKKSARPALVVFTDGFDANHNDTAPGSKAGEKEVFAALTQARIPVFTIGFGEGADRETLARLADLSGGLFQTADETSLDEVFSRLEATVAREYLLAYRRPQKAGAGIRPVISICVDTSGSMASNLEGRIPGSRRETARKILHSMLKQLPKEALVQILDFDSNTQITQTATADRARNHSGIAAFADGGGTDILRAVSVAMQGLLAVPSNRRYMLFLTDEAIKVNNRNDEEALNRLLVRMKDEGIFSMWIGMIKENENGPFHSTARKAGGEAIIADSLETMQQTIDRLLARVAEPVNEATVPFELVWQMPQAGAQPVAVSGNGIFPLPPVTVTASATVEAIDTLQITCEETAGSASQGDKSVQSGVATDAAGITAAVSKSGPLPDNVRMAIDLDLKGQNGACSFRVSRMAIYDTLDGLAAPKKKLFAVFELELANILPEQDVAVYPDGGSHPAQWVNRSNSSARISKAVPPYLINDLSRHLYLRWNNDPATPCSPAGWLFADSLTPLGSNALLVKPGQPVRGKVVFLVSDEQGLTNGALDFFDKSYGHLSMIIAGAMAPADWKAAALPTSPVGSLGTAFKLSVSGMADVASPLVGATAGPHLIWRIFELEIESQVQALLDIDPRARMHLALPTAAGPLRLPVSPATALLPCGFYDRVKLSPGSANHFRQAYLLPAELAAAASGTICVDLKGPDTFVSVNQAEPFDGRPAERLWSAEGNGLKLKINGQGRLPAINGRKGNWLLVDATVADLPDGSATQVEKLLFLGRADLKDQGFALNPGERMTKTSENKAGHKGIGNFAGKGEADGHQVRIYPDSICRKLLFAAGENSIVPDGQELRFIAVFSLPAAGEYLLAADSMSWNEPLGSAEFPGLQNWLLAENDEVLPALPEAFEKQLTARLKQLAAEKRQQTKAAEASAETVLVTDVDGQVVETALRVSPPVIAPWAPAVENQFRVEIIIDAVPADAGAVAQTGAAASALSGGSSSSTRSFKVLNCPLPEKLVARSPFEILYSLETGKKGENLLKASLLGIWGASEGRDSIDLKAWRPVREKIAMSGRGVSWPMIERELPEWGVKDRIHSVVVAVPDIAAEQLAELKKSWEMTRGERTPDHISLWQWFAHARLAAFIHEQSAYEKQTAASLGVVLNRDKKPRLMILTGAADQSGVFDARLDLAAVQPDVNGEKTAVDAFRIAAGLFVSELEARIMQGKGVFQFWGAGNRLQVIADNGRQKNAWLKFAEARGVGENVLKAIRSTRSVVLFPEVPAMVNNRPFWAWLEINPKTYETIGVLETGEHGTIAGEAIIQALIPDGSGIALGFWKGTESAVWGMSAFILQGDSALQAAIHTEKLLGDLAEQLGKISDSVEVGAGGVGVDLLSGKVTLAGFSSEGTYSPWEGYKGFVTGFNAGASWYLKKVKAAAAGK